MVKYANMILADGSFVRNLIITLSMFLMLRQLSRPLNTGLPNEGHKKVYDSAIPASPKRTPLTLIALADVTKAYAPYQQVVLKVDSIKMASQAVSL